MFQCSLWVLANMKKSLEVLFDFFFSMYNVLYIAKNNPLLKKNRVYFFGMFYTVKESYFALIIYVYHNSSFFDVVLQACERHIKLTFTWTETKDEILLETYIIARHVKSFVILVCSLRRQHEITVETASNGQNHENELLIRV